MFKYTVIYPHDTIMIIDHRLIVRIPARIPHVININRATDVFSPTPQDFAIDFRESAPVKLITANLTMYVSIVTTRVMVPTIPPKSAQLEERERGADGRGEIAALYTRKSIRGIKGELSFKPMGCSSICNQHSNQRDFANIYVLS